MNSHHSVRYKLEFPTSPLSREWYGYKQIHHHFESIAKKHFLLFKIRYLFQASFSHAVLMLGVLKPRWIDPELFPNHSTHDQIPFDGVIFSFKIFIEWLWSPSSSYSCISKVSNYLKTVEWDTGHDTLFYICFSWYILTFSLYKSKSHEWKLGSGQLLCTPNSIWSCTLLVHIPKLSAHCLNTLWGAQDLSWAPSFSFKYPKYTCLINKLVNGATTTYITKQIGGVQAFTTRKTIGRHDLKENK